MTVITRENAIRFSLIAVSGLLFLGASSAWTGLGYLNPFAWLLEWSSVILAFLCVYGAVRTNELQNHAYWYALIAVSLIISGIAYYPSTVATTVHVNINQTINPYYFFVLGIPLLLIPLLILYDIRNLKDRKLIPFLFFLTSLGSMGFLLYMFYSIGPSFPTDESVFDMYAAHLFLLGQNPYNPALMSGAFSFYGFHFQAFDPITPLTTGGYVNTLTYPALSFLVFIPAVLLHIKASLIMVPVLLLPMAIVWYRAWSRKQWIMSAYALLPFISLMLYAYQGASADTDAFWASLLMASYFLLPRHRISGIFLGLSLSVKQFPAIIVPFYLYYMYREYGGRKAIVWAAFAAATFLALNGYFIIQNPGYWLSSMVANEFAPLIGIGFGIPQVSFSGLVNVPGIFFTIAMVEFMLFLLVLYVVKYKELKYALFSFPILIFILNYRLFPQYLYYWMIVSILPMLDIMHKPEDAGDKPIRIHKNASGTPSGSWKKIMAAVLIALIVGGLALGYHEGVQNNPGKFAISSVSFTSYNSTGYVDTMNVVISYQGPVSQTPVHFRIFNNRAVINGNMFLWEAPGGFLLHSGQTYNLTITPQYPDYAVNPGQSLMIVAYYGNIQGSFQVP